MRKNTLAKIQKTLYFLLFITSCCLVFTTFYIEFRILAEMSNFGEPLYQLPLYDIRLKGNPATLFHLINIIFGILAVVVAWTSYKHLNK